MIETPAGAVPDRRALNKLRAELAEFNRRFPSTMTQLPRREWPFGANDPKLPNPPARVWRSSRFVACLYIEPGKTAKRLSICRARLNDQGQFEDGLSWDELQQIKRECGFGEREAVEVFPRDQHIVNVSNMRHLWILEGDCEWTWRD